MAEQSDHGLASAISLPTGGGAIKGIGETFQPDLFTGTGNFSVPIPTSPGREGLGPKLTLHYSTGNGNGPFGLGWQLPIPRVSRRTEKGLPSYTRKDVFVLSGAEHLVECRRADGQIDEVERDGHTVTRYRPRTEGLFARIERWEADGVIHWRAITRDNITSIYGRSAAAQIVDPANPARVFEWLLQETFDAKGNHILYEYAAEPPDLKLIAPYEENRSYESQRYIRRILYGNVSDDAAGGSGRPSRTSTHHLHPLKELARSYVFEVVFDYSTRAADRQTAYPARLTDGVPELTDVDWELRPDPFSSYRSGFELRTLRRCHRVLMFHHFTDEEGVKRPGTLVKATELEYEDQCAVDGGLAIADARLSLLSSVTIRGYRWEPSDPTNPTGTWHDAAMPPLQFGYARFEPESQRYQSLRAEDNESPPFSLRHPDYEMVDLQGDALPDVLETSTTGFRYWRNLGGRFGAPHPHHTAPFGVTLSQPGVAFGDLGGDGLADLIVDSPLPGFYETTPEGEWRVFKKFGIGGYPDFGFFDPAVRLLDLTGDGRADALMTTQYAFHWFECLGEEGYAYAGYVSREREADRFPDIQFSEASGRVALADLSGDGLLDIVLLHDGRIDYWPNLGRGRFGKRITMAHAPRIGHGFDPRRLFLVDLDGTGCADAVYVDHDRVRFWFNCAGNAWSDQHVIEATPFTTDLTALRFADVFGTGTATLLWSYDQGVVADGNYKALDFCGGVKPYVLNEVDNNLGATTRIAYAPSTKFYLQDLERGQPWVSSLPFPVQVVEKVEVIDHISRTKLVTSYMYHHGYYDGQEREFRGFGRVDQLDTESFDEFTRPGLHAGAIFDNHACAFHVPPTETRTWFHTGLWFDEKHMVDDGRPFDYRELTNRYRREYYALDAEAWDLTDHELTGVTGSPREAYRALRGAVLRTEVYGRDGSDKERHPYLVSQNRYRIDELQAPRDDFHGVFLATRAEGISYHYERDPEDPRIAHDLTLATDACGNVTDSVIIGYPRRSPKYPEQAEHQVIYTKTSFINCVDRPDWQRVGVPYQIRRYEVRGVRGSAPLLQPRDFENIRIQSNEPDAPDECLDFHEEDALRDRRDPRKRLIEWTRNYFRVDAVAAELDVCALGPGQIDRLGLPCDGLRAVFTDSLVEGMYGPPAVTAANLKAAGYVREADVQHYWWAPSGRQAFDPDAFYRPIKAQDPFGNISSIGYDEYRLLPTEAEDPLKNRINAEHDYRVLQPRLVTDPNRNQTEVAFDALGLVVGTAVMGKPQPAPAEGDALGGFVADFSQAQLDEFFDAANPRTLAPTLLRDATTRIVYDLHRFRRTRQDNPGDPTKWQPASAATLSRETHASVPPPPQGLKIQLGFSYSDGFGREIQKKIQAEPVTPEGGHSEIDPRWVGSGWTRCNNKGKPVRQYEPFFSASHGFEFNAVHGVSPLLFYDPAGRVVAMLHPNHSYEKVVFDSWQQTTHDVNDTLYPDYGVTAREFTTGGRSWFDPADDDHVGWCFKRLAEAGARDTYWPTWLERRINPESAREQWPADAKRREAERIAARSALAHAATPTVAHLDVLGRVFLTRADNGRDLAGNADFLDTHVEFDIQGNDRVITDPMRIRAFEHQVDMLGRKLRIDSADAGRKVILPAVDDKPVWFHDANGNRVRTEYDPLRRPTKTRVMPAGTLGQEILAQAVIYGESLDALLGQGASQPGNHRGQVYAALDGAGLALNLAYDFKGNLLASSRRVARDYGQGNGARGLPEGTSLDWSAVPFGGRLGDMDSALRSLVEDECFLSTSRFDALNRVIRTTAPDHSPARVPCLPDGGWITGLADWLRDDAYPPPFAADGSVYGYKFNDAGMLEKVELDISGERHGRQPGVGFRTFVENIDYNEKGQRARITYGNGVVTEYEYCPETYRLLKLTSGGGRLQHLRYTYDPAGNIAQIEDAAFPVVFHANQRVCPTSRYAYDPAYRLIRACGREHQSMGANRHTGNGKSRDIFIDLTQPINNGHALRNYIEEYAYDKSGNLERIHHIAGNGGWTRQQTFATAENAAERQGLPRSNRLLTSGIGSQTGRQVEHRHDANGNMDCMPDLPVLDWDHANQLRRVQLDDSGSHWAWYTYDAAGQRSHKVIEKNGAPESERIYVGGFELWRDVGNRAKTRATVHVMDGQQRVALVETESDPAATDTVRIRYQLTNHLGSAVMQLDEAANAIGYEELYPYGGTAYLAGENWSAVERKRYRYSGKERDDETGLYYYGKRYCAPWMANWLSCDRLGVNVEANLYSFIKSSPIYYKDPDGSLPFGALTEEYAIRGMTSEQEAAYIAAPGEFSSQLEEDTLTSISTGLASHWHNGTTADRVEVVATGIGLGASALGPGGDLVSFFSSGAVLVAKPSLTAVGDVSWDLLGIAPGIPPMGTIRRFERLAGVTTELKWTKRLTSEYRNLRKKLPDEVLTEVDTLFERPEWKDHVRRLLKVEKGQPIHHGIEWQKVKQLYIEHLLSDSEFVQIMRENPEAARRAVGRLFNDVEGMRLTPLSKAEHIKIHKTQQPMAPAQTPPPPDVDQARESGAWIGRFGS